ncbi:MAG: hypothetical protein WCG55_02060 [bacterium]
MSFWNNKEYDSLKMLLVAVLVTAIGLFTYNEMKIKPLENAGRVISTSASGNHRGAKGGNPYGSDVGGGKGVCDQSVTVALVPSYNTGTSAASFSLNPSSTSGVANTNVNLGTYRLDNPSPCPMNVTMMKFISNPSTVPSPSYSVIQNIKLYEASSGTQFGATLPFTTPIDSTGTLPFTSTVGVNVPAYGYAEFTLVADGRNVPPPAHITIQLTEFSATNILTTVVDHAVFPTSMPLVSAPTVTFVP